MKKITLLLLSSLLIISCVYDQKLPIEKIIPSSGIEVSGTDANVISISGDTKLYMIPEEDNSDLWSIRVSIPIKCVEQQSVDVLDFSSILVGSADGAKTFVCKVQDSSEMINLIRSAKGTQKNIVFIPKNDSLAYDNYENISTAIERTNKLSLSLEFPKKDTVSNSSISETISNTFKETKKEVSEAFKSAKKDVSNTVKKANKEISKTLKDIF